MMKIGILLGLVLLIATMSFDSLTTEGGLNTSPAKAEVFQPTPRVAPERAPVVVELFTSEGCSSCPPADDVLARLQQTQPVSGAEIIALGQHVDYWNSQGWADPFSSPAFSARQGDYAQYFGRHEVYTPQMIVNGQTEFSGGNYNRAVEAISEAAKEPKAIVVLTHEKEVVHGISGLKGAAGSNLSLEIKVSQLPEHASDDTALVFLAITEDQLQSSVSRGENEGRRLRHTAVVRQLEIVGSAGPNPGAFTAHHLVIFKKEWKQNNLRAVVFVQEQKSRRVLGAAALDLGGR